MSDKTYNGWTNYETWAVAPWMSDEPGSVTHWRERGAEQYGQAVACNVLTRLERAQLRLADEMKEHFESGAESLLNSALSEVNWQEIAEHYIDTEEANAN